MLDEIIDSSEVFKWGLYKKVYWLWQIRRCELLDG